MRSRSGSRSGSVSRSRHRRLQGERTGRSVGGGGSGRNYKEGGNNSNRNVGDNGENRYDGLRGSRGSINCNGNVGSTDSGMRRCRNVLILIPTASDNLPPLLFLSSLSAFMPASSLLTTYKAGEGGGDEGGAS